MTTAEATSPQVRTRPIRPPGGGAPVPVIRTDTLHKHYHMGGETVRALDGVSIQIDEGEMVAILGSSGSGKSTLMNIIGCLDSPTSGTYWLKGEDVSRLSGNRLAEIRNRRIGFVFQQFNLLSRISALENVEVPLMYAGTPDARARAEAALRAVGLGERMTHEPNQLSGGQRQRVAIARALVNRPDLLLCDEPTGNLDSRTSVEIMQLFKELHAQGRTIIIVTHEHDVAAECQRAIHLRDGRVVEG
jgi:putative ABC transport system ATP-binding protein